MMIMINFHSEPLPPIQCKSQEALDCEKNSHHTLYSIAAISSASDTWSGEPNFRFDVYDDVPVVVVVFVNCTDDDDDNYD